MKNINFVGSIFGNSGYDSHTRGLANAVFNLGNNVRLDCPRPTNWELLVNDNELKMLTQEWNSDFETVAIMIPPYYRLPIGDNPKRFYGFCVYEGDKVPKFWLKYLTDDKVNKILVPSMHTKKAIIRTTEYKEGLQLFGKIKIVPHGFDPKIFYVDKDVQDKKDDKFTFVANKGWRGTMNDRGGVQFLLKAFSEEFKKSEKVRLMMKINTCYNPNLDLDKAMKEVGVKKDNQADILVAVTQTDIKRINSLYNQGDCFVCTQMADAFNLPGIEAMACGLPTIQTKFGGQTDYMTHKNSWYINKGKMVEVKDDIMYEGIKWFQPDIKDIRRVLRYAFDNQDEVRKKGKQALTDSKNWTWEESAKKLLNSLS